MFTARPCLTAKAETKLELRHLDGVPGPRKSLCGQSSAVCFSAHPGNTAKELLVLLNPSGCLGTKQREIRKSTLVSNTKFSVDGFLLAMVTGTSVSTLF